VGQNHLREQVDQPLTSRIERWVHLLTQMVLTSFGEVRRTGMSVPKVPALRTSNSCVVIVTPTDGRGYCKSALRASSFCQ
jgi:hypothetical protein